MSRAMGIKTWTLRLEYSFFGFAKIKLQFAEQSSEVGPELQYVLKDSSTLVFHDGKELTTLKDMIGQRKKINPLSKNLYQNMNEHHDTCGDIPLTSPNDLRCVFQSVALEHH